MKDPARPLRGALADLEALLGHAVVMTDKALHGYWKVPEPGFSSCVCVPVSSPSMPLGTLWAFCRDERDFSDPETNILEIVAGRIASDLERQVLVEEVIATRGAERSNDADRSTPIHLPRQAPQVDGWEIAAIAPRGDAIGGTFYDWFALADSGLAVVAGNSLERGIGGAVTASALRA